MSCFVMMSAQFLTGMQQKTWLLSEELSTTELRCSLKWIRSVWASALVSTMMSLELRSFFHAEALGQMRITTEYSDAFIPKEQIFPDWILLYLQRFRYEWMTIQEKSRTAQLPKKNWLNIWGMTSRLQYKKYRRFEKNGDITIYCLPKLAQIFIHKTFIILK